MKYFEREGHIFLQSTGNLYQTTGCYIWEDHNL